jgi:3-carboxy-cis,cis-muconate cycloisomerase
VSDATVASSGLFGELFAGAAVMREVDDRAWLQALLDAEAALARAQAGLGLVPRAAAAEISAAAQADRFDIPSVGRRAGASGNPVVPLVHDLRAAVSIEAARHVHLGATSQDILDTAMVLVAQRAIGALLPDLGAVATSCAQLADVHRNTLIAARTLMQRASPTCFGLKAAGWMVAVDEARVLVDRVRRRCLAVQLGGAAGNLAGLGPDGPRVVAALADELRLAAPTLPWHTDRVRVAELAAALGITCGVLGKVAGDLILLAQTEVGEVGSRADQGRSSSMPHKRNPVQAVLVVAAARRAPGLVATLMGTMLQEHERAAGSWHAEWTTVSDLLAVAGAAAAHGRAALADLVVDGDRMEAVVVADQRLMAEAVAARLTPALGPGEAHDLVRRCVRDAEVRGVPLRALLIAEPSVAAALSEAELDTALDPRAHLGATGELIDSALRAHREVSTDGASG